MEADELLKKMSNLCDLNTDLQVGPSLVYWQTIGLISQEQHLTLSVLKVLQCILVHPGPNSFLWCHSVGEGLRTSGG